MNVNEKQHKYKRCNLTVYIPPDGGSLTWKPSHPTQLRQVECNVPGPGIYLREMSVWNGKRWHPQLIDEGIDLYAFNSGSDVTLELMTLDRATELRLRFEVGSSPGGPPLPFRKQVKMLGEVYPAQECVLGARDGSKFALRLSGPQVFE